MYAFRVFRVYDAEVHLDAQLLSVLWVAVGSVLSAAFVEDFFFVHSLSGTR